MMLDLKIEILNEEMELMIPGEGGVRCIHRVQSGMIKLFRRRTTAAASYNIYSEVTKSFRGLLVQRVLATTRCSCNQ